MEIITYVGCGLSLTAEVLTIIAYCTLTWVYKHNSDCVSNCGKRQEKGRIQAHVESPLSLLHRSARRYTNETLSPMRDISPLLTHKGQPQHRELHALLFSRVGSSTSHIEIINMKGICETGPTVYSPYPRRLESLIVCWCNYKGTTFYSVILIP